MVGPERGEKRCHGRHRAFLEGRAPERRQQILIGEPLATARRPCYAERMHDRETGRATS